MKCAKIVGFEVNVEKHDGTMSMITLPTRCTMMRIALSFSRFAFCNYNI